MKVIVADRYRDVATLLRDNEKTLYLLRGTTNDWGRLSDEKPENLDDLVGVIPAVSNSSLGSPDFQKLFGLSVSYSSGAMAGGIASTSLVSATAKGGGLGFFGAGGLSKDRVFQALDELKCHLKDAPFGCNLLHSPTEPALEMDVAKACVARGVKTLEAAAFLKVTEAVVFFRAKGLRALPDGSIQADNHIFVKLSRPEVATQFLKPPAESMLRCLVASGKITAEEARLAQELPVATAITAEADSGGHTDQRPLSVLFPLVLAARDEARQTHGWTDEAKVPIFIGAAGGLGDPNAILAAFTMGADFVSTGSLNQSCVESGTSEMVKEALCKAGMADVVMAPSADLFEMGGRVQVLRRGTMFAQRAQKLLEAWRSADCFENLPAIDREKIERDILKMPFDELWIQTQDYWRSRNPSIVERAQTDGKLRMALNFRAYLGLSSRWALSGDASRKSDFQVWCGPSIGTFNMWCADSWLQAQRDRHLSLVIHALFRSTGSLWRRSVLQSFGVTHLPSPCIVARPPDRDILSGFDSHSP